VITQALADRILWFAQPANPFDHDLCVTEFPQSAEQYFPKFLPLPPSRIGVDCNETVRHGSAAAKGHAQVVNGIWVKVVANLVAFFKHLLAPSILAPSSGSPFHSS